MSKRKFTIKGPPVKVPAEFSSALNPQQLEAVMHAKGPALVIAGAGSGKTRVLTYRVGWLMHHGAIPQSIMLVTFTRKAAQEMVTRVKKIVQLSTESLVAGTFHHVAVLFLRRYAKLVGFEPNFSILDRADSNQIFKAIRASHVDKLPKENRPRYPDARTLGSIYSTSINLHLQIKEVLDRDYPQYSSLVKDIEAMMAGYFSRKKAMGVMDFDDLLVYFLRLLRLEDIGEKIGSTIKHLLVDEYQDVNQIQADIVYEIGKQSESVMVVGDDAQAIYSFRGSEIRHIMEFESLFNAPVSRYYLTINYRSTPQILALANASIKHNEHQFEKELEATVADGEKPAVVPANTKDDESHFVCQYVLDARDNGIPLEEQAVLFRAKHHSLNLQKWLLHYNIPFVVRAGMAFFESAHVKDLIAYCLILSNPQHAIAWGRVLELVPEMGEKSAQAVAEALVASENALATFVTRDPAEAFAGMRLRKASYPRIHDLQAVFLEFCEAGGAPLPAGKMPAPVAIMGRFLEYYEPLLKEKYDNPKERKEELDELINFCGEYQTLEEMLGELAISDTWTGRSGGGPVRDEIPLVLSTIHQAKGLEWTNVHVIEARDNAFPNIEQIDESEIEEERRLFYVAATRAKKNLLFSFPIEVQRAWDSQVIGRKSMFLQEIEANDVFDIMELERE